jgi:transcriptional regulator with XRE-family HTH domain
MAKRIRAYSRTVRQVAGLLGSQVKEARVERRWTVRELAERAGVSTSTLQKVERGDPSVTLGVALDVASLVGVPLFTEDRSRLAGELARHRDRLALLPRRVREPLDDLENEF